MSSADTKIHSGEPVADRVLKVAREMFHKQGYIGTKTRHLAAEAGTSETGIFRVFDSKYGVLMAVYNDAWRRVNERINDVISDQGPFDTPLDELSCVIATLWRFYDEDPTTATFLVINTGNTDSLLVDHQEQATISDQNIAYLNRIEHLCEAAAEARLIGDISPRALSEGIYGLSAGVLLGWYLHDQATPERYPKKITQEEAMCLLNKLLR